MPAETPSPSLRERVRSVEAAAVAGIVFVILYSAALVLLFRQPDPTASNGEIAEWYADSTNRRSVILGLNLAIFSGIAFLWFIGVIRRRVGDREDRFFATVFLGSGFLFIGSMLVGSTALASGALAHEFLDGQLLDGADLAVTGGLGGGMLLVVVPRVQGVFVISTSTLSARTEAIPQWLTVFGYLIALVMMVVPIMLEPLGFAFPIWVAVTSVVLLVRRAAMVGSRPASEGPPPTDS